MAVFKRWSCILLAMILAAGCGSGLTKETSFQMGTFVEVTSPDPRAPAIVFEEFKRLEKIFSLYDESSELSDLNRKGEKVVSPDLLEILQKSKEFYGMTDGAFDVTIAPLALLWKRAIRTGALPKEEEIEASLDLAGFDNVYLDPVSSRVKLLKDGMRIDLGGIAKGFAVDKAVVKLKQAGVTAAIVNAGGNLYCLGNRSGRPWRVGVQDPRRAERILGKTDLEDRAVATSGDYEQYFVFQNKRYSHIINPKTGWPADSGIASATVIAGDATSSDALATAMVVVGLDKSKALLAKFPGVHGYLIDFSDKVHEL